MLVPNNRQRTKLFSYAGTVEAKKGGYNSNGTPIETEAVKQTDNSKDVNAIESYLTMINDDAPINHIFHNRFTIHDSSWNIDRFLPFSNFACEFLL